MTGTEQSFRNRLRCKLNGHEWIFYWADRRKVCRECDRERSIEKDYSHSDADAEIGEKRFVVNERDRGSPYRVEREEYQKTAHSSDEAWFQWYPSGGFYTDEEGLRELQDEIERSLHAETDRGEQ